MTVATPGPRRGSGRPGAAAPAGGRWWHYLSGQGAPGGGHDEFPVLGADREGPGVSLLEYAEHVGHPRAVRRSWAPADHDPPADIRGGEPDLQPVPHAGHLLAGQTAPAAGPPTRHSPAQAVSLTSVLGPAIADVMGGSTCLGYCPVGLPGFGLRVWSAGWASCQ